MMSRCHDNCMHWFAALQVSNAAVDSAAAPGASDPAAPTPAATAGDSVCAAARESVAEAVCSNHHLIAAVMGWARELPDIADVTGQFSAAQWAEVMDALVQAAVSDRALMPGWTSSLVAAQQRPQPWTGCAPASRPTRIAGGS